MTKDEALREAIDTLKSTKHGNCDFAWIDETLKKCTEALAQPPLPVQEPVACRFCHSKKGCWTWQCYHCGEIDDVQQPAPLPVQEPVAYDKTEMNSFVIDLYDKKMQEGKHGHYEIMFHVVHQAIKKVTLPLPVQPESVTWDKPSDNFNDWWDGDRRRDNANPFTTDSFAYWGFEGWQAALAQRPWQGLEAEDLAQIESDEFWQVGNHMAIAMAVEAKLKEKNHG